MYISRQFPITLVLQRDTVFSPSASPLSLPSWLFPSCSSIFAYLLTLKIAAHRQKYVTQYLSLGNVMTGTFLFSLVTDERRSMKYEKIKCSILLFATKERSTRNKGGNASTDNVTEHPSNEWACKKSHPIAFWTMRFVHCMSDYKRELYSLREDVTSATVLLSRTPVSMGLRPCLFLLSQRRRAHQRTLRFSPMILDHWQLVKNQVTIDLE